MKINFRSEIKMDSDQNNDNDDNFPNWDEQFVNTPSGPKTYNGNELY
jgi:hypothetical protein